MKVTSAITEFADFASFDYKSLYPDNQLFDFFAQPWVPFLCVFLYLMLSKPVINILISMLNISPDSKILKVFIIGHSAILGKYITVQFLYIECNIVYSIYLFLDCNVTVLYCSCVLGLDFL